MNGKYRAWDERRMVMLSPEDLERENRSLGSHGVMVAMDEDSYTSGHLWNTDWIKPLFATGLKDKNGVEIYEGDLVTWTIFPEDVAKRRKPVEVQFKHGVYFTDTTTPILGTLAPHRGLEVVGNIYSNPELLNAQH